MSEWTDNFFWGAMVILRVFAVALVLTILWGVLGAAAKLSNNALAQRIAGTYTVFFRGTPSFLVVLIFYFGSSVTVTWLAKLMGFTSRSVDISPFWAGTLAISLIVGAYATETFRGALQAIDKGQVEAGRALGLTNAQIFFRVKLPQMWRFALPGLGNHMNSLIKDTSLLSVIGVEEITYIAEQVSATTQKPFTAYIVVAAIYLFLTSIVALSVARMERRASRHLGAAR